MCPSTRSAAAPALQSISAATSIALTVLLLALAADPAAAEPCKLGRLAELPVTMEGMRPLVHAAINGKDALFIADSGAYFSMLTPAAAREFNLRLEHMPFGFNLTGVGGSAEAWLTTVGKFTIFGVDVPRVSFLVAGNDLGSGAIGLLGQNLFRLGDVEYDLANGVIGIVRTRGDCRKTSLAYWAHDKKLPYSAINIEFATQQSPHTRGEAYVNGTRIHVLFDTGAAYSFLTFNAAKHAGVTAESPGVVPGGISTGIGRHAGRTWIAPFASFRIGDEEIRNTHLRIGDLGIDTDMLIGADFFLSHHLLVASSQHKLYFTYNGGPVFNLTTVPVPARALTPAAAAAVPSQTAPTEASADTPPPAPAQAAAQPAHAGELDPSGYARRGSAAAARRDYEHALADLTRAIELAPTEAGYFYERGMAYWSNRQPDKALEDFSQAIRLKPDDVPALLARAELRARRNEPADLIRPDLDAADRAAPKQGDMRGALGGLYMHLGDYRAAIAQYDDWIDSHNRDDIGMAQTRNSRGWARALSGQGLDQALDDCNFAVRRYPKAASFLDSRALVYLRQGKYDKAVADYDAALVLNPKSAWSLYGRGVAQQRLGQVAAGQADIAAAKALAPKIAEEAARNGIVP